MLYAVEVPPSRADTGFIDRAALYDAIPASLRARSEGRRVVYRLNPCSNQNRFYPNDRVRLLNKPARIAALQARVATDFPLVSHPILCAHPERGRKVLNVTPLHALGIEDMERAAGEALLRELMAFALASRVRYYHRWQRHDIVLWDNWRFLHSAEGTPTDVTRKLYRTGIRGNYRYGRLAEPACVAGA